ncbi:MAG: hypothetical protein JWO94_2743 [Verrucomicrobiaceae bacterium]|nr:hypothetical protein [Verrucomicrobiaceae bacterium]
MSLPFYNILHIVGALFLCIGFAALISAKSARKGMMFHGIGLLILAVSGFGQLAKLGMTAHMPVWVIVKIVLWLVLGFLPVLAKRHVFSRPVVVTLGFVVIAFAAYLGTSFYLVRPLPF